MNLELRYGPLRAAAPPAQKVDAARASRIDVIVWGGTTAEELEATIEHVLATGVNRVIALPPENDEAWQGVDDEGRVVAASANGLSGTAAALDAALQATGAGLVAILRAGVTVPRDWTERIRTAAASSAQAGIIATLSDTGVLSVAIEERPPWLTPEAISLLAGRGAGDRLRVAAFDATCFALTRHALTSAGGFDPQSDDIQRAALDYGERLREQGLECILADDVLVHDARAPQEQQGRRRRRAKRMSPLNGDRRETRVAVRSMLQLHDSIARVAADPSSFAQAIASAGRPALSMVSVLSAAADTTRASIFAACADVCGLRGLGLSARLAIPAEDAEALPQRDGLETLTYADDDQLAAVVADADVVVLADPATLPIVNRVRRGRAPLVASVLRAAPTALPDTDLSGVLWLSSSPWVSRQMFERFGIRPGRFELSADSHYFHPRPDDANTQGRLQVAVSLRPVTASLILPLLERLAETLGEEVTIVTFGSSLASLDRRGAPPGPWRDRHRGSLSPPQLATLLGQTDILIDPTRTVANGELAAQAMACGAVPIVSSAGEAADVVRDGRDGILISSTDPADWYKPIVALDKDWPLLRGLQTAAVRAATRRSQLLTAITQYTVFAGAHGVAGRS